MITTVTGNSPQEINTSLFGIESNINEQTKLLNSKIKEVNDAIAKINKILKGINNKAGVVSVNGKQGFVELTASDVGALPDTTVIPSPQVPSDWNATEGVSRILNKPNLAAVATSGRYSDLSYKPNLASVATSGNYNDLIDKPNLATVATTGDYDDLIDKPNLAAVATSGNYNDLSYKPNLASVATSGNYNDLNNKPTIPSVVDSVTDGNSNAVTSNAVYDKTLPLMGPRVSGAFTSAELCNYIVNNGVATACCSSAQITDGPNGNSWYNFLYIPHRNGIGGDNYQYGTLLLFEMTRNSTWTWVKHLIDGTWYEWKTLTQG